MQGLTENLVAGFGEAPSPLLIVSLILLAGLLGGWLARCFRIPSVTGNILAGVIIGPACLDLFAGADILGVLQPLSTFAMGFVALSVGSHLSYRRIHNALRRIILIAAAEVLGATVLVVLGSRLLGTDWPTALILGCIATATAPATTVALVREMRAKGTFVKTLLSVVALDNILCIMLFAFCRTILADFYRHGWESMQVGWALAHTFEQFSGSLLLAVGLGYSTERLVHRAHTHDFSVVFIALLLSVSLSDYFGLSPLLTSLFFGVYLGNASEEASRQTATLEPIRLLLFSCFFTIAGVWLHVNTLGEAGTLLAAYLVCRIVGKGLGACAGGLAARASRRIWANVPLGLVPQAGVAVGLTVLLSGDANFPEHTRVLVETIVLGAVTISEIIGPFFTRKSLRRAKEANKDRRRIIEFLQEEYITTDLHASDKWEALSKLTDFFIRTHRVPANMHEVLYASIREREREFTTAIGKGAAIPHGRIEEGAGIRGVLAICRNGIEFGAPDNQPVRILMLVVTPKGNEQAHLEVMASLAQMISDEALRTRLLAATDPNDAWETIESEDTRNYNYFLEEEDV